MSYAGKLKVPKWINTMEFLRNNSGCIMGTIFKSIRITYSHGVAIIEELEGKEFVRVKREGRVAECYLTPKGKKLADCCSDILFQTK